MEIGPTYLDPFRFDQDYRVSTSRNGSVARILILILHTKSGSVILGRYHSEVSRLCSLETSLAPRIRCQLETPPGTVLKLESFAIRTPGW